MILGFGSLMRFTQTTLAIIVYDVVLILCPYVLIKNCSSYGYDYWRGNLRTTILRL